MGCPLPHVDGAPAFKFPAKNGFRRIYLSCSADLSKHSTAYVKRQAETSLTGTNSPDFASDGTGLPYVGLDVDAGVT